jgi:ribosome maturation factor RimP
MSNAVQQAVAPRVQAIAEPLAVSMGYELVDVEYLREGPQWILRVYLDKAGGVTLDDCTEFSRALGPALDVDDVVGTAYSLEVSSPGLERPLKKPKDFERFAGKKVAVKTYGPIPNAKGAPQKNFQGKLIGLQGDRIALESDGGSVAIPLSAVAKAHLVLEM